MNKARSSEIILAPIKAFFGGTIFPVSKLDHLSSPSNLSELEVLISVAVNKVGRTSWTKKNCSDFLFSMMPFHQITAGTLIPPSNAEDLLPLKPAVLPLASIKFGPITFTIGSISKTGPLSLKKRIMVSSNKPSASIALMILPISLSKALTLAAYTRSLLSSR